MTLRCRVKCSLCGWKGIRTSVECECYDEWAAHCRPNSPGPGCPSGVIWGCPKGCNPKKSTQVSTVLFLGYVKTRKAVT